MKYLSQPFFSLVYNDQKLCEHVSFGTCKAYYKKIQHEYVGFRHLFKILDERNSRMIDFRK